MVRGPWHAPGDTESAKPDEYEILLGAGGPAIRIIGELNQHCEPTTAILQSQDWGTPWTDYRDADDEVMLKYVSHFYFGE